MVAPEALTEDDMTAEIVGGTTSLLTVTVTAAEVAVLPAASRATAVIVCVPLAAVTVFQENV